VGPLPLPTPNWANQSISPNLSPAFQVGLRDIFAESGNDIQLNWTHLETTDNASVVASPSQFVGPPYEIGPDASDFRIASGSAHFSYDAVNLDAGHVFCGCGPFQVRVFGGLQFARIGQDLFAMVQSIDGSTSNANTTHSLFTGAGPRLGMTAQYSKCNFDFLGEIAGSALIGGMQSRIDFSSVSPALSGLGITPPNNQSLTSPDATQVIPCIDCRLGAAYSCPVSCYGRFRIEGGYQAAVYVNAINQYSLSEVVTPPTTQSVGVFLRTEDHLQDNFTVHGPYLTASWVF